MENIPEEVRTYQQQFLAEEKARQAAKEAEKKVNPKKLARLEAKLKKPMRPVELERIAKKMEVPIVGGGSHQQLVNPDTGQKCAYTRHPGTMSPQVQKSVVKFLAVAS